MTELISTPTDLGLAIHALRKKQKKSRKSVALDAGCGERTLARIEKGEILDVGVRKMFNILDALGFAIILTESTGIISLADLQKGRKY